MKKTFFHLALGVLFLSALYVAFGTETRQVPTLLTTPPTPTSTLIPTQTPTPIPLRKILLNDYHIFQSFNNCGPASFSMTLSYYGINESQEILGQQLRPYQNPQGDNDDKSVTLSELAEKAKDYNLLSYHRPNGNIALVKKFIAMGFPVLTRTWLKLDEDIGHYRVIKGYDETTKQIIQDDSLQGKNLRYSYDDFMQLWKKFNYEYVILVPKEKQDAIEKILGEDVDSQKAWEKALISAEKEVAKNPNDMYAQFNISVAAYHAKKFDESITAFEKVQNQLPFRTLWYQIEPIQAYYEVGKYERVLSITENILNNHNRAFSELYILRGNVYKNQANSDAARQEYEKAVFYNTNLKEAQEALEKLRQIPGSSR